MMIPFRPPGPWKMALMIRYRKALRLIRKKMIPPHTPSAWLVVYRVSARISFRNPSGS